MEQGKWALNNGFKGIPIASNQLIDNVIQEAERERLISQAVQYLEEGQSVKGIVKNLTDYGAFIEIAPGVEGLIHVSEMSWSQHLRNPSDFIKSGTSPHGRYML